MKIFNNNFILNVDGAFEIIVNPRMIDLKYNFRHDIRWQLELLSILKPSIAIKANRFGKVRPISKNEKFNRILNLIENKNNYEQSKWFQLAEIELSLKKEIIHKAFVIKNIDQLNSLFKDYLIPLIDSMEIGYRAELSKDLGTAIINSDGIILKGPGATHRFYIAKILGLDNFPLKVVGVHVDWIKNNDIDLNLKSIALSHAIEEKCANLQSVTKV